MEEIINFVQASWVEWLFAAATAALAWCYRGISTRLEDEKKKQCFAAAFRTAMALDEPFDLLIYEMFFYPGIDVARLKGIPCVRQFSQPAWSERTWAEASPVFRTSAKLIDMQVFPKRTAAELGCQYSCLHDGVIRSRPALNIVYVPEAFQERREDFGEDFLFLVPPQEIAPGDLQIPYETLKKPVVYISLGSIISNRGFCKECIRAFGNTQFSVILNTGRIRPESLGRLPDNLLAYSFVPQVEVLSHTDVFLTHCGMNSINEALTLGVPMVAMPFLNDQLTNAQRIVELGLGKRVRSFPSRGKELLDAVSTVYENARFRKNAQQMQERIHHQTGWDEIVARMEAAAL